MGMLQGPCLELGLGLLLTQLAQIKTNIFILRTSRRYPKVETLGDYSKGALGGSFRARFDSFRSSPTGLST